MSAPIARTAAQQTFLRSLDALATGSTEDWVKLFAPAGVLEYPYAPAGYPSRVTGQAELKAHMERFVENFELTFDHIELHDTVDENKVIAELKGHGKARVTGKPYEQTYICVLHAESTEEGARITRYVDYWNPLVFSESAA